MEEQEPGVWLGRTATVTPDNERWQQEPQAVTDLTRAPDWAKTNPADDINVDSMLEKLTNG